MRLREKNYSDWGLSKEIVETLKKNCREERYQPLLLECAIEANSFLAPYIYFSLAKDLSYDDISRITYIPICIDSFYAYRRYCLSLLHGKMDIKKPT